MTVLVDSWAWIEYFKGTKPGKAVELHFARDEKLVTSAINIAEVFGFLSRNQGPELADEGLRFMMEAAFIIPIDADIAVSAALAKNEKKFGLADAIVFATAQSHKATILTGDSDFRSVEGVQFLE